MTVMSPMVCADSLNGMFVGGDNLCNEQSWLSVQLIDRISVIVNPI